MAELEHSPVLPDHVVHFQQILQDEARRREQFYNDIDEQTKAEFINGQIVVHSPARRDHLKVSFYLGGLLGNFAMQRQLGEVYIEKCLIRCRRNDYEPDICFFTTAKTAGFNGKQSVFPPPDLIVEVLSPSTERNDRTLKLQDYARHGVGEYWIVDADEQTIEQYVLPPGATSYELQARLSKSAGLTSVVLTGFNVPVAACFDATEYRRALGTLLASD